MMKTASISQIGEQLRKLSPDKLAVVLDFVSYLADREELASEALKTAFASESVLKRDWEKPEEAAAWQNL